MWSDRIQAFSAGIEQHGLNLLAVKVMAESGVDISQQVSKTLDDLPSLEFDLIVTVCGHADETCPVLPGRKIHQGFDDPPKLAQGAGNEAQALPHYRRVRDEIKQWMSELPTRLVSSPP